MTSKSQIVCAASGAIALVTFFIMSAVGSFSSPPSPTLSAEDIAQFYRLHATGIQVASIIQMASLSLLLVFYAGLSSQIRRMEQGDPVLSYVSLACGTLSIAAIFMGTMFWSAAAFRPERAPQIVLMLSDMAFFQLLAPAPPASAQLLAIGAAILSNRNTPRLFPRWFGYYSIVASLLILPAVLVVMFKTGPFAWDGLWGNFAPLFGFILWAFIAQYFMVRSARSMTNPRSG